MAGAGAVTAEFVVEVEPPLPVLVGAGGFVSEEEKFAFLEAGYTKQNILEVLLVIGMKTLSNYTNHIAETPLDTAFEPAKWQKAAA